MLVFGVTRNFEDAKSRLENLSEIVRQAGRPFYNFNARVGKHWLNRQLDVMSTCCLHLPTLAFTYHVGQMMGGQAHSKSSI